MIVVFGSMNVDIVMPVDHFPETGETVLCTADYLSRPGGKGANQAIAAARAGAKVAMSGKVGDDAFGRRSVNNLKTQGVWTTGIGISERPTGCATIAVNMKGANIIMVAPGANMDVTNDQLPDEIFIEKNILLVQMEANPAETFEVLARAHRGGATTILNASPAREIPEGVLDTVDYLIVNELEGHQLAAGLGIGPCEGAELAGKIASHGKTAVIVTREDQGAMAARGGSLFKIGALPVEVVDTTGAGDAFCGIFAASLLAGHSWLNAIHYASVGAGLACLGLGAQSGLPALDDIEASLSRLAPPEKIG